MAADALMLMDLFDIYSMFSHLLLLYLSWLIVAKCCPMATVILDNIGSGNGLLPVGTKPLPEPMLTYHHKGILTFIRGQFHNRDLTFKSLKLVWNPLVSHFIRISQGPISREVYLLSTNHTELAPWTEMLILKLISLIDDRCILAETALRLMSLDFFW